MAAVLKDTTQKCDDAIDEFKKRYVGAIEELEGAGWSAQEHFTNCKAEGKGRPYTYEFERLSRAALASGASANSCRDMLQIHSNYLIRGEKWADIYVPHKRWYSKQREAVGAEAWLWAMIKVAMADDVLQHGCDGTGIDRQGTFAQWALIETDGTTEIVTMEAGGVLIGGTAEETKEHI